jgi:hypothetical protein
MQFLNFVLIAMGSQNIQTGFGLISLEGTWSNLQFGISCVGIFPLAGAV